MPSLPIPMISAAALFFLLIKLLIERRGTPMLLALLTLCGFQAALIALVQHYGVSALRPFQPIGAAAIAPLAWLGLVTSAIRPFEAARDAWHILAPVFASFCVIVAPYVLDGFIPLVFIVYAGLILLTLRGGADAMPLMRLETGGWPAGVWTVIAISLFASACSDLAIVWAQSTGNGAWQPWIIALASSLNLLLLGALGLSRGLEPAADEVLEPAKEAPDDSNDAEIMARLAALMEQQKPYLDPQLSLSQLARKLILPVKSLSGAINRTTGENVSRYVNTYRINMACAELLRGENVTSAMLSAGFNTKSNFNREFLRVKEMSPKEWLEAQEN